MTKLFLEPIKDSRKIQSRVANETQRKSEHHSVPGNGLRQTHNTEDTSNTSMSTVTLYMLNFSVWSLVYTVQLVCGVLVNASVRRGSKSCINFCLPPLQCPIGPVHHMRSQPGGGLPNRLAHAATFSVNVHALSLGKLAGRRH